MNVVIPIRNQLQGFYTLHKGKVDSDGNRISGTHQQIAHFPNLITNNGLDSINDCPGGAFSTQPLCQICLVGTGSTAPAFTDTTMTSLLATTTPISDVTSFVDGTPAYWKWVRVYRFNAGTATGNLTEVGTGWASNDLFSHALILDGGGTPTTITVLSDEYLDVTYELRNYLDKGDFTGIMSISGTPYDIAYRCAEIGTVPNITRALTDVTVVTRLDTYATQTLATVYFAPSGSSLTATGATWGTYSSGNYYNDLTFSFGLPDGNHVGGIGSAMISTSQCRFQMNFTPKIPKDATKIMTLTFRISWSRYP